MALAISKRVRMPKIVVNGTELFYQVFDDAAAPAQETLVFSHGFLMNHTMFAGQIAVLKRHFRCIAFEHRGHGQSALARDGYSMDNLVTDAIALLDALNEQYAFGPVHFAGMSTGGFVGMRLALRRPDLLKSLALISTSAESEPAQSLGKHKLLLNLVRYLGWWTVIGQVMPMLFCPDYLRNPANRATVAYWREVLTSQDKRAMMAFGKAIFARDNVLPKLAELTLPVAVMVGDEDVLTTPEQAERMAAAVKQARLYTIPAAGHGAAIEKAEQVTAALLDFYGLAA